jgi:hypothetical protein
MHRDGRIIISPLIKRLLMSSKAVNDASRPQIEDSLETINSFANALIKLAQVKLKYCTFVTAIQL